jgi:glycerophosphoryl diester phosphodiesterase
MAIPYLIENLFQLFVDTAFAKIPQPYPGIKLMKSCKLISHRGEHDNKQIFENTIEAFDTIARNGIWGIEFDIRWTKDLHPVVFHDNDLKRVFKSNLLINETTLNDLKRTFPLIPTLGEIIKRYGKSMHLMVEIKGETYPDPNRQNQVLKNLFSDLIPEIDYHFISLTPEMFQLFDFLPTTAYLPISQLNEKELSALAIQKKYGGIMGHYYLLNSSLVKKHLALGQKIGTGIIDSKNCLFRELNRGVEWLFSNNAVEMKALCDSFL